MANPLPTFAVGVGRGGIEIMQTLSDIAERNGNEKYFDYLAMDSDTDMFTELPEKATTIELEAPSQFLNEDRSRYPYLTEEMEIGAKGAERQRSVGRYKLDSRGTPDFSDHFDTITKAAREHLQRLNNDYDRNRDSYNLFLFHSLGGGTGSGTFPLAGTVLHHLGNTIEANYGIDVYVGGVGILPLVMQDPEVALPKGNPMYYPNAYASLEDLSRLLNAGEEQLELPLYSRQFTKGGSNPNIDDAVEQSFSGNSLPVKTSPFSNYWLVGVEEDLILGGGGFSDIENYGEMIDRTVAESVYAMSQMESSVENWATAANGLPKLGHIGQSEIRVPIREIRNYCELKDERDTKQQRVDEEIPTEVSELEDELEHLKEIKRDPTQLDTRRSEVDDPEEVVRSELEQQLGVGAALVSDNDADDVEAVVSRIGETYGPGMQLLAIDVLDEMFDNPSAVPAVEEHWEEVIDQQWDGWNMNSQSEFGGSDVRTYDGKEKALERYFDKQITEYEQALEETEAGLLDKVPAFTGLTESTSEEYERWLESLRHAQSQVLEADGRYRRVQQIIETADDSHRDAAEDLDAEIAAVEEAMSGLDEERRKLNSKITSLSREIDAIEEELTRENRVGQRLSILPIKKDALDELTTTRLENDLNSLDDYVGEFIEEDALQVGIEQIQENAESWDTPTARKDYTGFTAPENRNEVWIIYGEENESYANEYVNAPAGATSRRAGQTMIGYSDDPYSIQFVTFANQGPVEALIQYQRYNKMSESETLDAMAGKFGDERVAFAYPEWYDRDVAKYFDVARQIETIEPPELDSEMVKKADEPFETPGHRQNYIKSNGLDLYLWHGTMWEHLEYQDGDDVFQGWEAEIDGLTFTQLQQATPDKELKSRWLAGQADWEEVLEAYKRNLEDQQSLELIFEAE